MVTDNQTLIGLLTRLGERVERRTRGVKQGSVAFARIAEAALAEVHIPRLTLRKLLQECFGSGTLPPQRRYDEGFGQPAVTVYHNKRFTVDLLYWNEATTGIHQHQFAGAFTLLYGSSLHTRFNFQRDKRLSRSLILGSLSVASVEILKVGDIRLILPSTGLIHSLFHLESPSVTIAIRSLPTARPSPEYEYIPPNLAIDPRARDGTKTIHKQLLALASRYCRNDFEAYVKSLLPASDIHGAFLLLSRTRHDLGEGVIYRRLIAMARHKHGSDIDKLLPAIEEQWRRNAIVALRSTIVHKEQRLFIALLLNLLDLHSISVVLSGLYPNTDQVERIISWVCDLSSHTWVGLAFNDTHEIVLRGLLERLPVQQIAMNVEKNDKLLCRENSQSFREVCAALIASPILEPLFK